MRGVDNAAYYRLSPEDPRCYTTWTSPVVATPLWNASYARCLGVRWAGDRIGETDDKGDPIVGDTILLLMNAHHEAIPFMLPTLKDGQQWERPLETAEGSTVPSMVDGQQPYELPGCSMVVLRTRIQPQEAQYPEAPAAVAER